jgi:hypothetical protein
LKTYPFSVNATLERVFIPFPGLTDLGSLHYHSPTRTIYGVAGQWLYRMDESGNVQMRKDVIGICACKQVVISVLSLIILSSQDSLPLLESLSLAILTPI